MTPEERELRRVLDSRSAAPSPEFRAGLRSTLETGKPVPTVPPAYAIGVASLLTIIAIGVLVFAGPLVHPRPDGPPPTSLAATPTYPNPVPGVLVPPPVPIVLSDSAQLSVPSGSVAWVLVHGQYLYRSNDHGSTWTQQPMPPAKALPVPEISFVSSEEGWLSTGGYSSDCTAARIDFWHTSDAGASWALLGSSGIAAKQCARQLSFVDSVHGFLVAWENNSARVIYRTSDGGMTWSPSQPLQPEFTSHVLTPTLNVGLVRAFGPTLLVPAYGYNDTSGGIQAVFQSTDGGATWYVATAKRGDDTIVLVSATRWLQLIGPGQSVETTDRYTWHSYASDYSQAAPVPPQFAFGDAMVGYATVRGGIQLTVDGGLHWTDLRTPGT